MAHCNLVYCNFEIRLTKLLYSFQLTCNITVFLDIALNSELYNLSQEEKKKDHFHASQSEYIYMSTAVICILRCTLGMYKIISC